MLLNLMMAAQRLSAPIHMTAYQGRGSLLLRAGEHNLESETIAAEPQARLEIG